MAVPPLKSLMNQVHDTLHMKERENLHEVKRRNSIADPYCSEPRAADAAQQEQAAKVRMERMIQFYRRKSRLMQLEREKARKINARRDPGKEDIN